MSGVIDTSIVTLIDGNGSYESPLEMKINDVEINKVEAFLNNLKQLGSLEIETEETDDYTVFKIKISLQDKSSDDLYITFNVDNTLEEVISAINELKEDNSVESNPEETPETKPDESGNDENAGSGNNTENNTGNNTENDSTGSDNKLPKTGSSISSAEVVFIALVITIIGVIALKKNENIV